MNVPLPLASEVLSYCVGAGDYDKLEAPGPFCADLPALRLLSDNLPRLILRVVCDVDDDVNFRRVLYLRVR